MIKSVSICFLISLVSLAQSFSGGGINRGEIGLPELNEASGLVASRINKNILWSHNDSGDKSRVFALDTNGNHVGTFYLKKCKNVDWEDIAAGPAPGKKKSYLYVADIGDNFGDKKYKTIYRFLEPKLKRKPYPIQDTIKQISSITLCYSDTSRDAEALIVDPISDFAYIISKREPHTRIYKGKFRDNGHSRDPSIVETFSLVDSLPIQLVTAADISPDGLKIILKTYDQIFHWKREKNVPIEVAMKKTPQTLPYTPEPTRRSSLLGSNGGWVLYAQ